MKHGVIPGIPAQQPSITALMILKSETEVAMCGSKLCGSELLPTISTPSSWARSTLVRVSHPASRSITQNIMNRRMAGFCQVSFPRARLHLKKYNRRAAAHGIFPEIPPSAIAGHHAAPVTAGRTVDIPSPAGGRFLS